MTSLTNSKLQFRVHPEIYTIDSLKEVIEFLNLNEKDLIVTGSFVKKSFAENEIDVNCSLLNTDDYGIGEPKDVWVNEILKYVDFHDFDRIIAIGGGATIDISKYCVVADNKDIVGLFDNKLTLKKKRKLVAIPTTCGTGSEVTSVAVVERSDLNSKLGLQIDALFPDEAILCQELLKTLPFNVFVSTSIDALSHAVESYLSPKCTMYSGALGEKAIDIILKNLRESSVTKQLPDLKQALIAANMAGIAFSIGGCATMHACSFPIGANYHLPHGLAVYATFRACIEYYEKKGVDTTKLKTVVAQALGVDTSDALEEMYRVLESVAEVPNFKKLSITDEICKIMAQSVYENQQRLLVNSPITLSDGDIYEIFKSCLERS